jgi:hypothetical protein
LAEPNMDSSSNDTMAASTPSPEPYSSEKTQAPAPDSPLPPVKLNIGILFIGTGGDLTTPLVAAKRLRQLGHRVRIIAHPRFRSDVEAAGGVGLFYSSGRLNPRDLSLWTQNTRDENKKVFAVAKALFAEMGERYWGGCVGQPDGLVGELVDGEEQSLEQRRAAAEDDPFVADAIIANMSTFMHTSIAARMGIPLHFQFPNSRFPTRYIPQAQSKAGHGDGKSKLKNGFSYWFTEIIFNQLFKYHFNEIRANVMGLEPFSPLWQMSQFARADIHGSCAWSKSLVDSPPDWPATISATGYIYPDTEQEGYAPSDELETFLTAGPHLPIYIGFGSISFIDPERLFLTVLAAVEKAGVRVILAPGWSGIQGEALLAKVAEMVAAGQVHVVGAVPHSWLFPRVAAVVHHGGAGTTTQGLKAGRPTLICPAISDQWYWGRIVHQKGLGPEAIPISEICPPKEAQEQETAVRGTEQAQEKPSAADKLEEAIVARLTTAIRSLVENESYKAAAEMSAKISAEPRGEDAFIAAAMQTFSVYEREGRCDVMPDRPAVWRLNTAQAGPVRLSALAAHVLVREGKVREEQLRLRRAVRYVDYVSPGDPVTGLFKAIVRVLVTNPVEDLGRIRFGKNNAAELEQEREFGRIAMKPKAYKDNWFDEKYGAMGDLRLRSLPSQVNVAHGLFLLVVHTLMGKASSLLVVLSHRY